MSGLEPDVRGLEPSFGGGCEQRTVKTLGTVARNAPVSSAVPDAVSSVRKNPWSIQNKLYTTEPRIESLTRRDFVDSSAKRK